MTQDNNGRRLNSKGANGACAGRPQPSPCRAPVGGTSPPIARRGVSRDYQVSGGFYIKHVVLHAGFRFILDLIKAPWSFPVRLWVSGSVGGEAK